MNLLNNIPGAAAGWLELRAAKTLHRGGRNEEVAGVAIGRGATAMTPLTDAQSTDACQKQR